jgi:hypothetical protein
MNKSHLLLKSFEIFTEEEESKVFFKPTESDGMFRTIKVNIFISFEQFLTQNLYFC